MCSNLTVVEEEDAMAEAGIAGAAPDDVLPQTMDGDADEEFDGK